ncbi:MAG TPA: amidase family protein, partial [Pyrinomonadaceae bacterium]|nr:amidase family protein [Pyrinomonadaceae bacterium]
RALTDLTAVGAVTAIRNGEIKAEDYARALLDRTESLEKLNVFRALDREVVLEAARGADKKRASGVKLGKLHGLPIPVKDSVNTKALPTSNGTLALRNFRPKEDAAILKPLFAEGAMLMGKTNIHELSYGHTTNNLAFGPTRNPYDTSRVPGGSSGGSAAAVAAHMAPLAVAEDTFGSIRVPASFCGIAGLRPSVGRYPGAGLMPITPRWDTGGPLARTVADLILFDSVVTGDMSAVARKPLRGVRIGLADYFLSEVHPEVARVTKETLRKLEFAGAKLVWADVSKDIKVGIDLTRTVHLYETAANMSAFLKEHESGVTFEDLVSQVSPDLQPLFRDRIVPGAPNAVSKTQYEAALAQLGKLREEVRRYFVDQDVDVLAFPCVRMPPPLIGEDKEIEILGQKVPIRAAMGRNLGQGSCAGLPCLVLPAGLSSTGLPIGFEFDAMPGQDRKLLALGLTLERALGPIPAPRI